MQQSWLKRKQQSDLVLYMLGWASNPNAVLHIDPPNCDVLAVYDYREAAPLRAEDFANYRRIYLFAWSFGVWAAEQYCRQLPLYRAIALNGTPYPVSDEYGMRLRVVLRTMQGLARTGATPFDEQAYEKGRVMPSGPYPDRTIDEKIDELTTLAEQSRQNSSANIHWHKAYIGDKDEIFPPAKMEAYWSRVGLGTHFSSYHYPFTHAHIVLDHLEPSQTDDARSSVELL